MLLLDQNHELQYDCQYCGLCRHTSECKRSVLRGLQVGYVGGKSVIKERANT